MQIISLTLKEKVFLDVQNNVQVARRAAVKTSLAISRKANAGSIFHACRNLRVDRPLSKNPAFPFALGAGIRNYAARALAGGAALGPVEDLGVPRLRQDLRRDARADGLHRRQGRRAPVLTTAAFRAILPG